MSRILDKPFDKAKKIVRGVFKGAPNLLTTSDLNRQIEALKYQMDSLDDKVGVLSDMKTGFSYAVSPRTLSVNPIFSYMETKGSLFSPSKDVTPLYIGENTKAYLVLTANQKIVTYEDDSSKEISGAKFIDGTSQPAANHIVYTDEKLLLTLDPLSVSNLVAVIALYVKNSDTEVVEYLNCVGKQSSVTLSVGGMIKKFTSDLKDKIKVGMDYDSAFSSAQNQIDAMDVRVTKQENLKKLTTEWTPISLVAADMCRISSGGRYYCEARFLDGVVHVEIAQYSVSFKEYDSVPSLGFTTRSTRMSANLLYNSQTSQEFKDAVLKLKKWYSAKNTTPSGANVGQRIKSYPQYSNGIGLGFFGPANKVYIPPAIRAEAELNMILIGNNNRLGYIRYEMNGPLLPIESNTSDLNKDNSYYFMNGVVGTYDSTIFTFVPPFDTYEDTSSID